MEASNNIKITITGDNGNEFTKTLVGDDLGISTNAFLRLRNLYIEAEGSQGRQDWAGKAGHFIAGE